MSIMKYDHKEIDHKWQERWAKDKIYEARDDSPLPKYYALTMFPYTSGDLHIGHWYAMAPSDVHARFKRMQGFNVMHPQGFDAFGLPAENAAIKRGIHPHAWTMKNIENMRRQLRSIGACYDWSREVITCVPEYYKWTEWFFLKLCEAGLAYRAKAPVWWCPHCQTSLANEQVVGNGECERCSTQVVRKDLEQWFFRITKYAEEMKEHNGLDWPERIKTMQRNWVGKSEGAEISFGLDYPGIAEKEIKVFTTRPDTVFGVTFMVLAPEHPLVDKLTTPDRLAEVQAYLEQTRRESEIERQSTEKEKTGVFTGAYITNKLNGQKVPLWIADYVLLSYGTGVVMGVPAHDTRDFAFAKKYNIPIRVVIAPPGWKGGELGDAWVETGTMVNSGRFDGLSSESGKDAVCDFIERQHWGNRKVMYRLRDWLISRQRYWGAPIPMIYCKECGIVPVPEKDLPVLLPEDAEFRPTGESPLKYHEGFVNTTCPRCGRPARRETDTMDTFMCSSWYYFRYSSPGYSKGPWDPTKLKHWLPVDLYTGGAEHAVMHLFYSRFFTKALRDMGLIDFGEPFIRLFNQGTIIANRQKMSKSRGNVINPDGYVEELGADVVRCYLMFIGPWEQGGEWSDAGINGITRWLNRLWTLVVEEQYAEGKLEAAAIRDLHRFTHRTIKRVTDDVSKFHFNTMLAALMELTNYLGTARQDGKVDKASYHESIDALLLMLAPSAPHLAEELWTRTGHPYSVHQQRWPEYSADLAAEEEITLVIQVNGKLRDKVAVPASISETEAREMALGRDRVKMHIEGKEVAQVIYVPGRLVNVVTNHQ